MSEIKQISRARNQRQREMLLEGECLYQAKLLLKIRHKIAMFVSEIEDEGDRVYFGSTNDADDLRSLAEELDDFQWQRMEKNAKGRDLYQEMRNLNDTISKLGSEIGSIAADRDRASDACASVQRERDELREMLGEAKECLRILHCWGECFIKDTPITAETLWREFPAAMKSAEAFLARYEALK